MSTSQHDTDGKGTSVPKHVTLHHTDRANLAWLAAGLVIWMVTVLFAALQPSMTPTPNASATFVSRLAMGGILLSVFPLLFVLATGDGKRIGLTWDNAGHAVGATLLVTAIYSVIRNGLIILVPASVPILEASASRVAEVMKLGGFSALGGPVNSMFAVMLAVTFSGAAGAEVFFRGFLFNRIKERTHWTVALFATAALFGFLHYFNVGLTGLIMGIVVSLISGWLMQRYNNLLAPMLFHYLQYVASILVFYFIIL